MSLQVLHKSKVAEKEDQYSGNLKICPHCSGIYAGSHDVCDNCLNDYWSR